MFLDIYQIASIQGQNLSVSLTQPSLVAQWRIRLPMQETQVRSLGLEDPLENEVATHSSILAGIIPWTGEPGGLQPRGSQRVRPNSNYNSNSSSDVLSDKTHPIH